MTDQQSEAPVARADAAAEQASAAPAKRRRGRLALFAALGAVIVAGAGIAAALGVAHGRNSQLPRPDGIAASITDSQVSLMDLSPTPRVSAPGFRFTDQNGHALSLSDLRGKVVVLEFMDPHCTDICPIVSAEFVDAYRDLGKLAPKVVFAAINVNQYHARVADMLAFSREHQLVTIPDWHFFTGRLAALRTAWSNYHITVEVPKNPNGDIIHSSAVYFIDPSGHERYLASPQVDHNAKGISFLPAGQVAAWGQGIAQVVRTLLR